MTDEDNLGYAKVRDGVLDHHKKMSWAEIGVFHHLLNRANRKDTRRWGPIGLCPGLTGNKIAEDIGKSRDATHRALAGLAARGYIEKRTDGIFIRNFDPAGRWTGLKPSRPEDGHPAEIRPAVKRPDPAGIRTVPAVKRPDPAGIRPPIKEGITGDGRRETKKISARPPAALPEKLPVAYWDSVIRNVVIDKDWLREEIREYSQEIGAVLTEPEYERQHERLKRELLRDPRLRACIRKADGTPSTPSKFKALASYVVSQFKAALDFKADHEARASPNATRKAKTDEAFRSAMKTALQEEQRVGDETGSDSDLGAAAAFLPPRTGDR